MNEYLRINKWSIASLVFGFLYWVTIAYFSYVFNDESPLSSSFHIRLSLILLSGNFILLMVGLLSTIAAKDEERNWFQVMGKVLNFTGALVLLFTLIVLLSS